MAALIRGRQKRSCNFSLLRVRGRSIGPTSTPLTGKNVVHFYTYADAASGPLPHHHVQASVLCRGLSRPRAPCPPCIRTHAPLLRYFQPVRPPFCPHTHRKADPAHPHRPTGARQIAVHSDPGDTKPARQKILSGVSYLRRVLSVGIRALQSNSSFVFFALAVKRW